MKPRVYLETTVPSYLTARPSRDLIRAAHQQLTREWWDERRSDFELFVSQSVLREIAAGDATAAERLKVVAGLPILDVTEAAIELAERLVQQVPLPTRAAVDAIHIAVAAESGMDYLLTWNCRHIANAAFRLAIQKVVGSFGHQTPVICTPGD